MNTLKKLALAIGLAASISMTTRAAVDISTYAWQFPSITNIAGADDLKTELQGHIDGVLTNGHLAPLYISRSDQQSVGYALYLEPGRIITTLAYAYPHVTGAQQTSIRNYVASELADSRFAPWSAYPMPKTVGTARELHPKTQWWYNSTNFGANRPSVQTIYGLWLYAYRSGDWNLISNNWANIKTVYTSRAGQGNLYGTMSAHIAMARLADHFGDAATRTTATNNLQTQLNAGLTFATIESNASSSPYADMYDARMDSSTYRGWMFLSLSPEMGRYLRDNVQSATLTRHNSGKSRFPLWWVLQANYFNRSWTGDEGTGLLPEVVGMIAPVERWVVQASASTLRSQVKSAPTGLGDCYWLESLVQTIEAYGTLLWVDVRNGAPPPPDTTAPAAVSNLATGTVTTSSVALSWTAPGDDGNTGTATSYDVRYSTATITTANWGSATQASGEPTPGVAGTAQNFTVSGLSAGTTYFFALKTSDEAGNISALSNVPTAQTSIGGGLPSPWVGGDIGAVGAAGSASYSAPTFTVTGSGADIWGNADEFQFVRQTLSGDGTIVARVATLQNTDPWSKAGVMMRETIAPDSKHCMVVVSSANGVAFQRRVATAGASTNTAGPVAAAPYWVRLQRAGNIFTASASSNGSSWTTIGTETNVMTSSIQVGLAVTSHLDGSLCTATFDNVSVTTTSTAVAVSYSGSTNSFGAVADAAAMDIVGSAMCMEAFVKVTALPAAGGLGTVLARELGSSSGYALLVGDNGRIEVRLGTSGNNWGQLDSAALTWNSGQWYHVAASYDGTTIRIFRDGTQVTSGAQTGTLLAGANKIYFGGKRYDWSDQNFLNGVIDEARLSKVVRYTANFTAPTAPFTNDSNTVGLWHFNENTGTASADVSGNGLTVTLTGATWTSGKF